jgi:antibiotic biosynthesis monooxygenase (ABM) superfamily enzyme
MAIVLYQVTTSIDAARDDDFNRWYNERHCPDLLTFPGCTSARRYRSTLKDDAYQYLAVYEFRDQATYEQWMSSDHRARMIAEHRERFGPEIHSSLATYVQIWPEDSPADDP